MDSLFNYKSEDDRSNDKENMTEREDHNDGTFLELDTNYDNVMMEMSEDSSSESQTCEEKEVVEKSPSKAELSSSSSSSLSSSSSESSSSKSDSEDRKYSHKKVFSHTSRRSRSPIQRKLVEYESSSHDKDTTKYDDTTKDKRLSESDRYGDRNKDKSRELDKDRDGRKRSPKSPRHERLYSHKRRSRSPTRRRRSSSRHRSRGFYSYKYRDWGRDRHSRRSHSRGRSQRSAKKLSILGKLGIELKVPKGSMTPQMALEKTMQDQVARVKDATGIALPSYYNPIAVNPTKYAEQMQKRKLLWGSGPKANQSGGVKNEDGEDNSKTHPTGPASLWQGATFSQDQDGKLTAKFKRLMGMKKLEEGQTSAASSTVTSASNPPSGVDLIKKQEEMFNSMEMQYEVARVATHTHRGLGLGFGLHQYPR